VDNVSLRIYSALSELDCSEEKKAKNEACQGVRNFLIYYRAERRDVSVIIFSAGLALLSFVFSLPPACPPCRPTTPCPTRPVSFTSLSVASSRAPPTTAIRAHLPFRLPRDRPELARGSRRVPDAIPQQAAARRSSIILGESPRSHDGLFAPGARERMGRTTRRRMIGRGL
jgi:hypothetical protein